MNNDDQLNKTLGNFDHLLTWRKMVRKISKKKLGCSEEFSHFVSFDDHHSFIPPESTGPGNNCSVFCLHELDFLRLHV